MAYNMIGVGFDVDYAKLDAAERKIVHVSEKEKQANLEVEVLDHKAHISLQRVMGVIHQGYSMVTQFMNIAGFSIDATTSAIVSSAFSMAGSLYAMANAASSNPWTAATAAFTFISASSAMGNAVKQQIDANKMKAKLNTAKNAVSRVSISL